MNGNREDEVRGQFGAVHENYTQIAVLKKQMESAVKSEELLRTQRALEKEFHNEISELKLFISNELNDAEVTTLKWFLKTWMALTSTAVVLLTSVISVLANFFTR